MKMILSLRNQSTLNTDDADEDVTHVR